MPKKKGSVVLPLSAEEIIHDYRLAYQSRQASLIGRREVLSGKAKFGIFGDGKEAPNLRLPALFAKAIGAPATTATRPGSMPWACLIFRPFLPNSTPTPT